MQRIRISFLTLVLVATTLPARAATIVPGDLIKASGATVYYHATDGKRYVFPTEKTYFTWYADFGNVKTITDAELAAIPIGGNVTYRPGVKLLKITTDPKTYAIDAGKTLRWITTEEAAKQLYGNDWATKVDDLPDPFFINYKLGADIASAADYSPTTARDAHATIQATLTAATPTPTPSGTTVTLTTNKPTAQANESVEVYASTNYVNGITAFDIYIDDQLYKTCQNIATCSFSWTIPTAGTKSSYTYRAKLTTMSGETAEATTSTAIVSTPIHSFIQMSAERTTIRPNQASSLRSLMTDGFSVAKNEIYIDGVASKVCTATPNDCRYTDSITGAIGSSHSVYAIVTTGNALMYKSNTLTVTIGTNDTPAATLTPSKTAIYPNETVDMTLTASDDDGLASMDIGKYGVTLKSCAGAAPCTVTTGPWNVPSGSVLSFEGRAYDMLHATATVMATVTVQ